MPVCSCMALSYVLPIRCFYRLIQSLVSGSLWRCLLDRASNSDRSPIHCPLIVLSLLSLGWLTDADGNCRECSLRVQVFIQLDSSCSVNHGCNCILLLWVPAQKAVAQVKSLFSEVFVSPWCILRIVIVFSVAATYCDCIHLSLAYRCDVSSQLVMASHRGLRSQQRFVMPKVFVTPLSHQYL